MSQYFYTAKVSNYGLHASFFKNLQSILRPISYKRTLVQLNLFCRLWKWKSQNKDQAKIMYLTVYLNEIKTDCFLSVLTIAVSLLIGVPPNMDLARADLVGTFGIMIVSEIKK